MARNVLVGSGVPVTGWQRLKEDPPDLSAAAAGKVWVADLPDSAPRVTTLYNGLQRLPRARSRNFNPTQEPDKTAPELNRYPQPPRRTTGCGLPPARNDRNLGQPGRRGAVRAPEVRMDLQLPHLRRGRSVFRARRYHRARHLPDDLRDHPPGRDGAPALLVGELPGGFWTHPESGSTTASPGVSTSGQPRANRGTRSAIHS